MQKTGIIITLSLVAALAAGGFIFSQLSYKICFRCDADKFYNRGLEYACNNKESHRQTGLDFIKNSADLGHLQAELTLAELFSPTLPAGYSFSNKEQRECLLQDIDSDQTIGTSYFESVITAMDAGQEIDPVILDNLALLYLEGLLSAEDHADKASMLYEKAAAKGSFPAMLQLGILSNDRGYYKKAMQWFVQASESPTDVASPLMVGDYYMFGKGVTTDYHQAQKWYNKALAHAGNQGNDANEELALLKNATVARLDMVNRKLGEDGTKLRMVINYHLQGGVKHFVIFTTDHPEQPLGEVINNNGNIYAMMNENLELTGQLPIARQDNFSSMNEGMEWVLTTFANNSHENAAELIFDFVLTKP